MKIPQLHPMHWLAFLVRGLCTNLKDVVAYYFTGNVTSFQLLPLFWKVVGVLETTVKLWVIAAVNDGASPNRKFFALHSKLGGTLPDGLVYKTPNLFFLARMIYFFADVPHLIKTARNCLYNSGSGSCSRYMWYMWSLSVVSAHCRPVPPRSAVCFAPITKTYNGSCFVDWLFQDEG